MDCENMKRNFKSVPEDDYGFLIKTVMEDSGLSPESFSKMIHGRVGARTIYHYQEGTVVPPVWFWRELWCVTGDERILTVIVGDEELVITRIAPGDDVADVRKLANIAKKHAEAMVALADIYADGKVDHNDRRASARFSQSATAAVRELVRVERAIRKAVG